MATGVPASVVLTPGAANFAALKREVVDCVQGANDPELLDVAGRALNRAVNKLNTRTWAWSLTRQDITTVASQNNYSVNAAFKKAHKLQLLDSSSKVTSHLVYKEPKVFWDEHSEDTSDGSPCFYTVESPLIRGEVILDPIPSSAWVALYPTMRLHYFSRVQALVQDADVLVVPSEVQIFVVAFARDRLASDRGEFAAANRERGLWITTWTDLVADDNDTMSDWDA